jgi:hypothetical protein
LAPFVTVSKWNICQQCGAEFEAYTFSQKFCGKACRLRSGTERARLRRKTDAEAAERHRQHGRSWRENNPDGNAARNLRARAKKYGTTADELQTLLASDDCWICGDTFADEAEKRVDHCHKSGKIRGVLCHSCNVGIGHLRDSPTLLLKAAVYLKKEL